MDISFRPAVSLDFPAVWQMMNRIKKEEKLSGLCLWDENYPTEDILRGDIQRGEMMLGELDEQIVCLYVLNTSCDPEYAEGRWEDPTSPFYVIHRLCVDPRYQNQGIAKRTLSHLEQQARGFGGAYIHMDCCLANPVAYHLYVSAGYQRVGTVVLPWDKGPFALLEKKL